METTSAAGSGFTNRPIAPHELPDCSGVELNPVAAGFLPHAMIRTGGFWLLLAIVALVAETDRAPVAGAWLAAGALSLGLAALVHAWLDARYRGWALREHDLIHQAGVLWRSTVILPFARIQHVETASGPLERLFGLMRLKCYTAGGMTADLTIHGLSGREAIRIRHYLLEQIRDDEPPADG